MQDFKTAAAIWHTVVSLSFPQLHNIMAALSAARGFDMYAWMHADAIVLKRTLRCVCVGGGPGAHVYAYLYACPCDQLYK